MQTSRSDTQKEKKDLKRDKPTYAGPSYNPHADINDLQNQCSQYLGPNQDEDSLNSQNTKVLQPQIHFMGLEQSITHDEQPQQLDPYRDLKNTLKFQLDVIDEDVQEGRESLSLNNRAESLRGDIQQECEDDNNQNTCLQDIQPHQQEARSEFLELHAEVDGWEISQQIMWYVIVTSNRQDYKYKVKRRYNDFKQLIQNLGQVQPTLILPYIPVGVPKLVPYLASSDQQNDRLRILQNVLQLLLTHRLPIHSDYSKILLNFLKEDYQEFKIAQDSQSQNAPPLLDSMIGSISFRYFQGSKKFNQLQSWFKSVQPIMDTKLREIEIEIEYVKVQKVKFIDIFTAFQKIVTSQKKILSQLEQFDRNKQQFENQTKSLSRAEVFSFDFSTKIKYDEDIMEKKLLTLYTKACDIVQNMVDLLDHVIVYHDQFQYELQFSVQQGPDGVARPDHDKINHLLQQAHEQIVEEKGYYHKAFKVMAQQLSDTFIGQLVNN